MLYYMVRFIDLDISQLHKIIKAYKLETQIIPPKKKISQMSKAEIVAEIEKHLELRDDKIYFKQHTGNFDIPKKSKPRPVNPNAPERPKKPTKGEIIEQLKQRISELEKTIEELSKGKSYTPTERPLPKQPKQPKQTKFIKQEAPKAEKFKPEIRFQDVRKAIYNRAKEIKSKQYLDLLKDKTLMKEIKRIYENGDIMNILDLSIKAYKSAKSQEAKMEIQKRIGLINVFLSAYNTMLKDKENDGHTITF